MSVSCQDGSIPQGNPVSDTFEENRAPKSFIENCGLLKNSDGFRQNFHLCANHDARAWVSMDLDHNLYLFIPVEGTISLLTDRFDHLRVSKEWLDQRMDKDEFILDSVGPSDVILKIPADAGETFGADAINQVLKTRLAPADLSFQWD